MIKKSFIHLFALVLMLAAAPAIVISTASPAQAGNFSAAVDDLPIMQGMTELTNKIVVFDTPAGRLVETTMITQVQTRQILTYYNQALTSLGWKAQNHSLRGYIRKNEVLMIEIFQKADGKTNLVSFKIAPAPK